MRIRAATLLALCLALAMLAVPCLASCIDDSPPTAESLISDLQSLPWYADYRDRPDRWEIEPLVALLESGEEFDTRLIKRTIDAGWFVEGTETDLDPPDVRWQGVKAMVEVASVYPELSTEVVKFAWAFDDDITFWEWQTLDATTGLESASKGLGVWLAKQRWMLDGINDDDWWLALNMVRLTRTAEQLDRDFLRLFDLVIDRKHDPVRILDQSTLVALSLFASYSGEQGLNRTRLLQEITNAPWFNDGLDDEERVRIVGSGAWGDESFSSHQPQSETIDLPMAGEVTLWVSQRNPTPGYEDLLRFVEEAVRGMEQLMAVPFPRSDVVVTVIERNAFSTWRYPGSTGASHVQIADGLDGVLLRQTVYHTIANYYFSFRIAPRWLSRGGPEFAIARIDDWFGHKSLVDARTQAAADAQAECVDRGITNLHAVAAYEHGWFDYEHADCRAILGREFLLNLHGILGERALTAVLAELHPAEEWMHTPILQAEKWEFAQAADWLEADSDVYETILKHTPRGKQSEVKKLYRQKHGGSSEVIGN